MPAHAFDDVLRAARGGEAWACAQLYEHLKQPVVAYIRLRGAPDPDDVASDVFLNVFRSLGTFAGDEAAFRAWVFTIAHRRMLDDRRARARRPRETSLPSMEPVGGNVEEDALRQMGNARVQSALSELSPQQREVVLLRIVADLSLQEVAQVTGRSVTAVKALQHRAVTALRRSYSSQAVTRGGLAAIWGVR